MKKPNNYSILLFFVLLFSLCARGQGEKFDIISYTPPTNWKKESKPGAMNYIDANPTTGGFCVITIFTHTASSGDAMSDFTNSWSELVAKPYEVNTAPKAEKQPTDEGWEIVAGAAPAKIDGTDVYIILTTLSGFGKTVSIRASLNDQSYMTQLAGLLETIELDKTKPVAVSNIKPAGTTSINSPGRFGNMNYAAPAGWSHQVFTDGVVFKPLDLPAGEHLAMQVMQPLNFAGSLEQALAMSFDEAAKMYNATKMNYAGTGAAYAKTEARRSFQGWDYIRCNGGVRIGNEEYPPEYGLDLFVIKVNNRFERVAVLKSRKINRSCSMSSFYADERIEYATAINNFLFHLQFSDGPQPILAAKGVEGGGIKGIWQGISMQTSATSGIRYNVFSPIFLSNGQAYFGTKFPSLGLEGLDTRVPAEINRRDWGTYTFSNGRGVLKMPYADIPLRMEGNTLIIKANQTDHKFYQLPSVDGARFNGTYVMSEAYGAIPTISFTTGGRFIDKGAIRVLYHEYNDCINPALQPGSGDYEVKDHTITFSYTDGRKIKIAFLGAEYSKTDPSPASILMSSNEDRLHRQ